MNNRKSKAKIFEVIEDSRIAQRLTREALGKMQNLPKERVDEIINDAKLAKQFYQVMKMLEDLRFPLPFPASYFKSEDIKDKE